MRKIKILLLIPILSFIVLSCENNSNKEKTISLDDIKTEFKADHADASEVEWNEKEGVYEVEFIENNTEKEIIYTKEGEILESEVEISKDMIPEQSVDYIKLNFQDYRIESAEKIENESGLFYEVDIVKSDDEKEIIFNNKGIYVRENLVTKDEMDIDEAEGNEIEEIKTTLKELPKRIKDSVNLKFPEAELIEINKTEHDNVIKYTIDLRGEKGDFVVEYDSEGNFIPISFKDK